MKINKLINMDCMLTTLNEKNYIKYRVYVSIHGLKIMKSWDFIGFLLKASIYDKTFNSYLTFLCNLDQNVKLLQKEVWFYRTNIHIKYFDAILNRI